MPEGISLERSMGGVIAFEVACVLHRRSAMVDDAQENANTAVNGRGDEMFTTLLLATGGWTSTRS